MESNKYWVGFDLGGTKMMATVFDANFKKIAFDRKKTRGNLGMQSGLTRIIKTIEGALAKAGITPQDVGGIGAGCPGPLNLDRGVILSTPNLGWNNVPLKATLQKHFGCPAVIANDVDAGTYGEFRFGAARKARCVLGVFPGTGIGGACVYEGKLLRGKIGSCMEIGHFPVDSRGPLVEAGRSGTLESMTSRLAISAQAAQAVYRGQAPALQALAGTHLEDIKSGILAQAIQQGDRIIEDIVRHCARILGTSVAGVVNLLAPDVLVLGGGLVEALPGLYIEEVRQSIQLTALPAFTTHLKVVAARLGDDAGAMGAAALAAEAALQKPIKPASAKRSKRRVAGKAK
jgi:glucokinase